MPLFIYVLSLAIFAQGTSEFMLSGLVPDIARGLSVPVASAASLTAAYAIGMVLGAPVMAAASARWPRRRALATFLLAFIVAHVVGAMTSSFTILFGTRIVAAMANAGFLAVAMSVAVTVGGPQRRGRVTATLLGGVTLACVAGVPAGAVLGQLWGWRSAFWAVAVVSLPALVTVLTSAPTDAGHDRPVRVRAEFRALTRTRLQLALVLGALVNGATFSAFAYLAVIATSVAGLAGAAVPGLLAVFGLGSFVGVTVAGRLAGPRPRTGLLIAVAALALGWVVFAVTSANPIALLVVTFVQGSLSFGVGATLVTQVLHAASSAPNLAGSFGTVALNTGAVLGPLLAGLLVDAGHGYRVVAWLSACLVTAALALLLVAERLAPARPLPAPRT